MFTRFRKTIGRRSRAALRRPRGQAAPGLERPDLPPEAPARGWGAAERAAAWLRQHRGLRLARVSVVPTPAGSPALEIEAPPWALRAEATVGYWRVTVCPAGRPEEAMTADLQRFDHPLGGLIASEAHRNLWRRVPATANGREVAYSLAELLRRLHTALREERKGDVRRSGGGPR